MIKDGDFSWALKFRVLGPKLKLNGGRREEGETMPPLPDLYASDRRVAGAVKPLTGRAGISGLGRVTACGRVEAALW